MAEFRVTTVISAYENYLVEAASEQEAIAKVRNDETRASLPSDEAGMSASNDLYEKWLATNGDAKINEKKYARVVAEYRHGERNRMRFEGYVSDARRDEIRSQVDAIFTEHGGVLPEVPAPLRRATG